MAAQGYWLSCVQRKAGEEESEQFCETETRGTHCQQSSKAFDCWIRSCLQTQSCRGGGRVEDIDLRPKRGKGKPEVESQRQKAMEKLTES